MPDRASDPPATTADASPPRLGQAFVDIFGQRLKGLGTSNFLTVTPDTTVKELAQFTAMLDNEALESFRFTLQWVEQGRPLEPGLQHRHGGVAHPVRAQDMPGVVDLIAVERVFQAFPIQAGFFGKAVQGAGAELAHELVDQFGVRMHKSFNGHRESLNDGEPEPGGSVVPNVNPGRPWTGSKPNRSEAHRPKRTTQKVKSPSRRMGFCEVFGVFWLYRRGNGKPFKPKS